jgi:DNA-binding NtrC family response regulator
MPRILVIDDDPGIRGLLRNVLTREGYEVRESSNGKEGLETLSKTSIDLVITDILMPEMEGFEFIISLQHRYPELKILAMSGGGQIGPQEYLSTAQMLGAHRTITKPFQIRNALRTIAEMVGPGTDIHLSSEDKE